MTELCHLQELFDLFDRLAVPFYLDGGWGIDCLLGRQTRPHRDVDIFIEEQHAAVLLPALGELGYREIPTPYTTPAHGEYQNPAGAIIDLHRMQVTPHGLLYEGELFPGDTFGGRGRLLGRTLCCTRADYQLLFHQGYAIDDNDRLDVHHLCAAFDLPLPESYQ